jgi:hypothetical protein
MGGFNAAWNQFFKATHQAPLVFFFLFFLSLLFFYLKNNNNNNKKDTFVVFRIQFYIFRILFLGKLPIYRSFIGIKQGGGEKHCAAIFFV